MTQGWRSKLKKKLRPDQEQPNDQAIRDVAAGIAARKIEEQRRYIEELEMQRRSQEQQEQEAAQIASSQAQMQRQLVMEAERMERREQERVRMEREQNAGALNIARLRALARERYRLDVRIWNKRDVLPADQHIILRDCKKADETLDRIYDIVSNWDQKDFGDDDEWKLAKTIKDQLLRKDQHIRWTDTPPWEWNEDGTRVNRKPVPRSSARRVT